MTALDRRTFLRISASGAGGLLIGFGLGCKDKAKPKPSPGPSPSPTPTGDGTELNGWIRIDPDDTVTMIVPEAEMGQGISAFTGSIFKVQDADIFGQVFFY